MSDLPGLGLALVAGLVVGAAYFAGLWLTLQRLPDSPHPALLTLGSFVARAALMLGGLHLVLGGMWLRGVAYLVGFTVARAVMSHRWGNSSADDGSASSNCG